MRERCKQNNQQLINPSSTYRVQSDQKELLVKNMKQEIECLKKNEQEYYSLSDEYDKLQYKLQLLTQDKSSLEKDCKMRHQSANRTVLQLKAEIEALKLQFREKRTQTNDLQTDRHALQDHIENKCLELEAHRSDIQNHMADSEQLQRQHQSLQASINKFKEINANIQQEHQHLKMDCDSVQRRSIELDKYCDQLIIQEKLLKDKIQHYEDENNDIDRNIAELQSTLLELEDNIKKAVGDTQQLQSLIAELSTQNDKYKSQISHTLKSIQTETMNNNNALKQLKQLENTLKVRRGQHQQGSSQISTLKEECHTLEEINSKLQQDAQACRKHLENLGLINSKLVKDMEGWTQQNERVQEMIDNRAKTERFKVRVSEVAQSKHPDKHQQREKRYQETRISTSRRAYQY